MEILHTGAQAGAAEGMLELSSLNKSTRKNNPLPRNEALAFHWATKAAATAYPPAFEALGFLREWGIGTPKNPAEAFANYKKAADIGLPAALFQLARGHEFGRFGIQKNEKEAVKIYQHLVEMGLKSAYSKLGHLYQRGLGGLPKDADKAAELYRKGVQLGDSQSYTFLGLLHEQGLGVEKNEVEALKLFRQGAENGSAFGQYHLGRLYEGGLLGLNKDIQEAKRWYTLSAELESRSAKALQKLQ